MSMIVEHLLIWPDRQFCRWPPQLNQTRDDRLSSSRHTMAVDIQLLPEHNGHWRHHICSKNENGR